MLFKLAQKEGIALFFAILTGIILYMALGMLYYSPLLFGNRWVQLLNIEVGKMNIGLLLLSTILSNVILYSILQLSQSETLVDGALIGGAIGLIVAFAYAKDFLFGLGEKSHNVFLLYLIAVGYHVIALTIIGAVMMFF